MNCGRVFKCIQLFLKCYFFFFLFSLFPSSHLENAILYFEFTYLFKLEDNYFAVFWWPLSYINMNQPPPPSHLPGPHPARYSQSTCFGFPASHIKLPLATYFTYGNIYVSKLFSQIITPPFFPPVSRSLFLLSMSPLLPCM